MFYQIRIFYDSKTPVSSHEEADTLMMVHALELAEDGEDIDFFSQDTDWMVLILKRMEKLGSNTHFVTGSTENRRKIALQPIYEHLGTRRALALPGFHAITGSDTTGRIKGVGKKSAFKSFMEASDLEMVISHAQKLFLDVRNSYACLLALKKFQQMILQLYDGINLKD